MIDLTPLDVRNKRGDFKKLMRGYDPQEVDVFLELVAERLEGLVRENLQMRDRTRTLQEQVETQTGREKAVQDALVTAQELRKDIREQSQREADHVMREAESEARRILAEAEAEVRSRLRAVERQIDQAGHALEEMERRRLRFLQDFKGLLRRELDVVEVEEERVPLEDRTIDLDLGSARGLPKTARPKRIGSADDVSHTKPAGEATSASSEGEKTGEGEAADDGANAERAVGDPNAAAAVGEPDREAVVEGGGGDSGASGMLDETVDVHDLRPGGESEASSPGAPAPSGDGEPSSLELELMAGASDTSSDEAGDDEGGSVFPDVPDLETVLAEAGVDEAKSPRGEEISPPPAKRRGAEDRLLFDKDEKDRER